MDKVGRRPKPGAHIPPAAHGLGPEVGGSGLAAGGGAGSSLVEPTSHPGLQGKDNSGARPRLALVSSHVSSRSNNTQHGGGGSPREHSGGSRNGWARKTSKKRD